ncbi:hypothetical protein [Dyadobacter chenhuakuii]|uniref:Uncharacterized protein n=1 Tax=Dyadobacter chenhuakuii TaxID=2909339 RepID=A0A9X1QJY4_9BACT|nr:hypothetical protein [Dyadobacter chenhuakuii]MCF2501677.1 hypothetical protein [Dyadobacter chenhuakuii]
MSSEKSLETVFVLYSEEDETQAPVAAFSDKEQNLAYWLAGKLNRFIEGGVAVKEMPSKQCLIPIDLHVININREHIPYNISLDQHGNLFEKWDILGFTLDEPILEDQIKHVSAMWQEATLNPDKQWGFGGTYWASTPERAIEKAKSQLDKVLKELGSTKRNN